MGRNCRCSAVGTRGRVEWMRGPCACPRRRKIGGGLYSRSLHSPPHRVATRTSTRPPLFSTSTPCPYRTEAVVSIHYPIRLPKSPGQHRRLALFLQSVVSVRQYENAIYPISYHFFRWHVSSRPFRIINGIAPARLNPTGRSSKIRRQRSPGPPRRSSRSPPRAGV